MKLNWKRTVATGLMSGVVVAGLGVAGLGMGIASAADAPTPSATAPARPALDGARLEKACGHIDALTARSQKLGTRIDDRIAKLQGHLGEANGDVVKNRLEHRIGRLQEARAKVGTRVAKLTAACATAG